MFATFAQAMASTSATAARRIVVPFERVES
jgi:hypothetical protein